MCKQIREQTSIGMVVLWHPQDFNGSESLPLLGHSIDEGQEEAGYHSKGQSHPHRLGPVMDEWQSLNRTFYKHDNGNASWQ